MEAFTIAVCAMCVLASPFVAILVWRRRADQISPLLKWAVLLWPCVGGMAACLGGLLALYGKSKALETVGVWLLGVAPVAFVAHLGLFIAYGLSLHNPQHERVDPG
ncbi:MAG TPA: hypothetical protein VGM37_07215 [Armatimonadota bacterium]|jgi:hypothetical protein